MTCCQQGDAPFPSLVAAEEEVGPSGEESPSLTGRGPTTLGAVSSTGGALKQHPQVTLTHRQADIYTGKHILVSRS